MAREQRLVFGEVAELYDKARPTYPSELIDHLVELGGPQSRVLDVGCGTGKATVLLAARGLDGIGLEPDREMAAVAHRNVAPFPNWSIVNGDFEDYAPGDGDDDDRFGLITCAQAWHWLDPAARFQHAARLLRPGGWLALFWNRAADDDSPLRRAVDQVYADVSPASSPHGMLATRRPPAGVPPAGAGFGEGGWAVFPWLRRYTTKEWTDLVQTHSDHRMLHADQQEAVVERLGAVIDAHGGTYDYPYNCWLWSARRAQFSHTS